MDRPEDTLSDSSALAPRVQEQLLIDLLPELAASRVLCTSAGAAQFALAAAQHFPQATVHCHTLDLYHAQETRRRIAAGPDNLTIGCAADFPPGEVDLVALPLSARGEAELTRDLMQAGHRVLAVGGRMAASTDNPHDRWLHDEMRQLFDTVTRRPMDSGVVYLATKKRAVKGLKNFSSEFVFRDRQRLITAFSRPGVFSHRRVDPGARQLLGAMEVHAGQRVLDLGCGCGVVSLAAAFRAQCVQVHAVDSCARAVQCTERGAALNGLTCVTAELNASGHYADGTPFDLVVANPPYYAAFQIAQFFLEAGLASLRPGGQILVVTKWPAWYQQHMPRWFEQVTAERSKDYYLLRGLRPT